jgi:hypothetical protein
LLSAKRPCAESFGSGSRHRTELSVEAVFPVVTAAPPSRKRRAKASAERGRRCGYRLSAEPRRREGIWGAEPGAHEGVSRSPELVPQDTEDDQAIPEERENPLSMLVFSFCRG